MAANPLRPSAEPCGRYPLHQLLIQAAQRHGNKTAIIDGDRRFSYVELKDKAASLASAFAGLGIEKGDRVAIFAPNCAEFVISFYAISWAGAVVTTLNPAYREREVEFQLRDSGAKALILSADLYPVVSSMVHRMSGLDHVILIGGDEANGVLSLEKLIDGAEGPPSQLVIDPEEDTVALPYSSGTTGLPKGVILTHYNLTSNVEQLVNRNNELAAPKEQDVILIHLPLYHIYGMNVLMNPAVAVGATQVMMARFDMDMFLRLLSEHKVTMLFTVPPVVLGLTQYPGIKNYDLSALRLCFAGAAPLSAELQDKLQTVLGIPTVQGYGLTETSPVTNSDFVEPERRRSGSVGPAMPNTEEMVVDLESGEKETPRGEVGELIVRGPQVMKGYWNNPEATAETIRDGWLYTGDMAKMDDDGYVYIVDRKKELIKYKGFQVAPAELEALLLEHPAISDAAVIGKPDLEAGEVPKAFVVGNGGEVTADEVMEYIAGQVATFKRIREVEFVDQIPKNSSGKVLRRVLVEQERQQAGA